MMQVLGQIPVKCYYGNIYPFIIIPATGKAEPYSSCTVVFTPYVNIAGRRTTSVSTRNHFPYASEISAIVVRPTSFNKHLSQYMRPFELRASVEFLEIIIVAALREAGNGC
jgi:hypothetical protein